MKCTNHFIKYLGFILLLFLLPITLQAQNITVKGTVKDAFGPVIGASVVQKGTTNGVVTDIDGNFTLSLPSNGIIVISFIGYKTQEIPVSGKKQVEIILKEDTEMLDEVVVVGYGQMKRSDLTGSVVLEYLSFNAAKYDLTNSKAERLLSYSPGVTPPGDKCPQHSAPCKGKR